jgi:hypothetical protein
MSQEEKDFIVSFDDLGATCQRPDGAEEKVSWADIVKVTLEATGNENPDAPDHIWIIWGRDNKSGCVYPGGATGAQMLLLEMKQRLTNFDVGAVGDALKAEENKTWLLWQLAGVNTPEDDGPHAAN